MALDGDDIVGRVRSVGAVGATWCADMYVEPSRRRRGIGWALMAKMLRDDPRLVDHDAPVRRRRTPELYFIPAWAMNDWNAADTRPDEQNSLMKGRSHHADS